jgi:hypothetical protein
MSENYSYRDARLSLWQTAAGEVERKRNQPATASLVAKSPGSGLASQLMDPVHIVAHTITDAGKPF